MKTSFCEAVVNFPPPADKKTSSIRVIFKGVSVPASLHFYEQEPQEDPSLFFVRIHMTRPLTLKWKDTFDIRRARGSGILGNGRVLNPIIEEMSQGKRKNKLTFLRTLMGNEKEMLLALAQKNGPKGLWEGELTAFSSLSKEDLLPLCQELEADGKLKILSFSPLFVLSQQRFHFLCQKIISFLERFHQAHPGELGVSGEKIKKKFDLHSRVLTLALKNLSRGGMIKSFEDRIALPGFNMCLSPEEEKLLEEMEKMAFKGELQTVSLESLRKHFRLSSQKFHNLLSLLIERRKIVQGKDGFMLHSQWLDEIIMKIRNSGKKELSVSDFKKMTGLSRKYAIPLLELLDQRGVTKRKGATREIL